MQAKPSLDKQERTVTETARRAQIVNAAIDVVAEHGYSNASFARIAKQAGLSSTGMISYHFRGKDDLLREVVAEIVRVSTEFVVGKLDSEADYSAVLRAWFAANLALLDEYPRHQHALASIIAHARLDDPRLFGLIERHLDIARDEERWIREAQRAGAFRDFDPAIMVMAIRGAREAAIARARIDPDFDTTSCARELADLFDRATRKTGAES
ncbi:TetR/AcrR family transcriptional regulator [Nocardia sp. NPDC051570]|uniref:TetR/AcrR family transcriptional regulator n=1 Tax=Nocardia sp. NPDC051570 TaxID=3364324 RepID=UPI0037B04D4F